jgi:NTP pyrophosphatase (non-canonical NTP hydrolase)
MIEDFQPLTLDEYEVQAAKTDQRSDGSSLNFPLLGLFGETGSLLSEVKKKQRDRASYIGYAAAVVEELGDVLWYLTAVASRGGLRLGDIAANLDRGYADWQSWDESLTFHALQPSIMAMTAEPSSSFEQTLLQLAGDVGSLVSDHQAEKLKDNRAALAGHLSRIMRRLIQAANEAGVTLEAAAVKNLAKTSDRWPTERVFPPFLDADADSEEQLPRTLTVDVFERDVGGQTFVFQRCNGVNIGDRLTDNAATPDDYRFHDVFHFAHMAVLGWSPVLRALFRLKRKSEPKIDEAEDGARAILIEEGVTTWIFGQAQQLNLFANMKGGDLPLDMLKHVRQFVAGYEVEPSPLWLWEDAILQGFEAFRYLKQHRRGRLRIDMASHSLRIEELPL